MVVWSAVKLSALGGAFRLDAEFWRPEYLHVEHAITRQRHTKLGDLAVSIRKGVFNILADSYVEEGIPFYRSSNVGSIIPRDVDVAYITPERHAQEKKTALTRGDLMLAKTGREAASVVLVSECNVSQDVIAVRPNAEQINSYYLAVFLNCEPGRLQMRRWFQGQVQPHLSLPDAREIIVPIPPPKFQKKVEALVLASEASRDAARRATVRAEARLLEAIGLADVETSPQNTYTRRYHELQEEARFDAEYFNPKYQAILMKLREGGRTLQDVATLSERVFDASRHPNDSTFRYIEIGSITTDGEAEPEEIAAGGAPTRATWIVKAGDVITSTVRPIRRLSALIRQDQDESVCSSGFAVLTPNLGVDGIEPEVLFTYLRLPVICQLLDLHTTASMYPAIPVERLLRVPIMKPGATVRRRIVLDVQDALAGRQEAMRLLDQAKETVEVMISAAARKES